MGEETTGLEDTCVAVSEDPVAVADSVGTSVMESLAPESTTEEMLPVGNQTRQQFDVGFTSSEVRERLVLPITVDGCETRALVDSGAASSMVCAHWMKDVNLPYRPTTRRMRGFGESSFVPVVGVIDANISVHGLPMMSGELFVIETQRERSIPVTLGEDFMRAHGFSVNVNQRLLLLEKDHGTISIVVGDSVSPCRVNFLNWKCEADTTIAVRRGEYTKVKVRNLPSVVPCGSCPVDVPDHLYLVEPVERGHIRVFPGICGADPPDLLVTSHSMHDGRVKKGETVCAISTLSVTPSHGLSGEVAVAGLDVPAEPNSDAGEIENILDFGTELSELQRERVLAMLRPLRGVFSEGETDMGKLDVEPHKITLLNETPVYQRPRRFNEAVTAKISEQCKQLELLDIIEQSSSSWSAPVVPVVKKDGSLRLCVDYRKLNAVTKPDRHPIPNLTDSVYSLSGMRYFSSLDLVRGYYQLPLSEDSRELTAFSTPSGHYHFKRLPFGLRNAPAAFQRAMQSILHPFPRHEVMVYIDDVLIMTRSYEEHLTLVERVLATLLQHGIKVKPSKCSLFRREVEFLGHLVGENGLRKTGAYMEKVAAMRRPETIGELREFLGLLNFQRKFVGRFSEMQKCLSERTSGKRSKRLTWTQEMEDAFLQLKEKICEDTTLAFPDYGPNSFPLRVYVDASDRGAGACLSQLQGGEVKVIAYISMTFSKAEQKYSTVERELAALRWAVKNLRPYLIGTEFEVYTDHQPLVYLHNMKIIDSRLARTLEDLADFHFKIIYVPGKDNTAADKLSRLTRGGDLEDESIGDQEIPDGLVVATKVDGGGDSLFESLHYLTETVKLQRDPCISSADLRRLVVEEAIRRPDKYGLELTKAGRKELRLMAYPGQLPSLQLIKVFGELFGCRVLVHYGAKDPVWFIPPSLQSVNDGITINLRCKSGVHYDPLIEKSRYERPGPPVVKSVEDTNLKIEIDGDESDREEICVVTERCDRHNHGHFSSVTLVIDDQRFCALLDTGAEVSCASEFFSSACRVQVDDQKCHEIRGMGPETTRTLGILTCPITIEEVGECGEVEFHVVPDSAMPVCVILGIDFLRSCNVTLSYSNESCVIRGVVVKLSRSCHTSMGNDLALCLGLPIPVKRISIGAQGERLSFGLVRDADGGISQFTSLIDQSEIEAMQRGDECINRLRTCLASSTDDWPIEITIFKRYRRDLHLVDGVVVHKAGSHCAVVVKFEVMVEMLLVVHHQMAHVGREKLLALVKQHIWHPRLTACASDVTATCDACQKLKVAPTQSPPMKRIETSQPFELVAVDCVVFPKVGSYSGCLVAMDHHSKWLIAVPLSSKTGEVVARSLEQRILPNMLSKPLKILSDNGPEFTSGAFNDVLKQYGINHIYTTPYMPTSNGLVERANRTLAELLRMQSDSGNWVDNLPRALMIHNSTRHSALGCSPSEFLLKKCHLMRDPAIIQSGTSAAWREGHPSFSTFDIGKEVLKKVTMKGNLTSNKLEQRFHGPFEVVAVNANGVTYQLMELGSGRVIRAHHSQLKSYLRPPHYLITHPYFAQVAADSGEFMPESESINFHDFGSAMIGSEMYSLECTSGEDDSSDRQSDSEDNSNDRLSDSEYNLSDLPSEHVDESSDNECESRNMTESDSVCETNESTRRGLLIARLGEEILPGSLVLGAESGKVNVNSGLELSSNSPDLSWDDEFFKTDTVRREESPEQSERRACLVDGVKEKCLRILDEGLGVVNSSTNILDLVLSLSTDSQTSDNVSAVLGRLKGLESTVSRINDRFNARSSNQVSETAAGPADLVEEKNTKLTEGSDTARKVIQTRSRGPVKEYPNVMNRPIEFKRRRKSAPTIDSKM